MVITMKIDSGYFDRRITLYKKNYNHINELGEKSVKIEKWKTIWAEVKGLRGYEQLDKVGTIDSSRTYKVVIRYIKDIDQAVEIEYEGAIYDITSVVELGRKDYIEIYMKNDSKILEKGVYEDGNRR